MTILDGATTQAEALRRASVIQSQHPDWSLTVSDGGARWASKGRRWLIKLLDEQLVWTRGTHALSGPNAYYAGGWAIFPERDGGGWALCLTDPELVHVGTFSTVRAAKSVAERESQPMTLERQP